MALFFTFPLWARTLTTQHSDRIGEFFYGSTQCTLFLYDSHTFITAKHCFTHYDVTEKNFNPLKMKIRLRSKWLDPLIIKKLQFLEEDHDLARIELKKNYFKLNPFPLEDYGFDQPLKLFTYHDGKVVESSCRYTGRSEVIPDRLSGLGYDGVLHETDCPGYYGNSGSPLFSDTEKGLRLVGLLVHTFELNEWGEVRTELIQRDRWGPFLPKTNFTSIPTSLRNDNYSLEFQ